VPCCRWRTDDPPNANSGAEESPASRTPHQRQHRTGERAPRHKRTEHQPERPCGRPGEYLDFSPTRLTTTTRQSLQQPPAVAKPDPTADHQAVAWTRFVFGHVHRHQRPARLAPRRPPTTRLDTRHPTPNRRRRLAHRTHARRRGTVSDSVAHRLRVGTGPLGWCRHRLTRLRDHLLRPPPRRPPRLAIRALTAAVGPLVLDGLMVVCGFALLANSLHLRRVVLVADDHHILPRDAAWQR
jgi:hypothetical protein